MVATAVVVMGKVAVVWPAVTVTVAGTVAAALPEVRVTDWPPVLAGSFKVTVPVEPVPPVTDVGLTDTLCTICERMVKVGLSVEPFTDALTVAVTVEVTFAVVIVTVPVVAPAAMVAVAGPVTSAAPVPDAVKSMVKPPVGAGELMVREPVVDALP